MPPHAFLAWLSLVFATPIQDHISTNSFTLWWLSVTFNKMSEKKTRKVNFSGYRLLLLTNTYILIKLGELLIIGGWMTTAHTHTKKPNETFKKSKLLLNHYS